MKELVAAGSKAPDFELPGHDGATYRLNELLQRTNVLLVFYPGNNTPG